MRIYLASPNNQMQASHARGMPVLLSYHLRKTCGKWIENYIASFSNLLIDSGAYSELTTGVKIDGEAYKEWAANWSYIADAIAGLDDISGDWRRSMRNYEKYGGFPTIHDTDPAELLDDLIPMAYERGRWIGIGLLPPRTKREDWLRKTLERIPDDLHIHGWALRRYSYMRRFNSMDSTNWWRDSFKIKSNNDTKHLTPSECLEIVVKRYQRSTPVATNTESKQMEL